MQTLQEIYSNEILPLSEEDRLKLAEMIVRDVRTQGSSKSGVLRAAFGTWKGRSPGLAEFDTVDHNELIDRDIAQS